MITRPIIKRVTRSIVRSITSSVTGLVSEITTKMLTFDGATSYGELAEPWVSTDANATEDIVFVATGTDYNLTNEITVVSGALSMDAGITSALLDGVSIGITGAIPNDGKLHTLTVGGTFNLTHISATSTPDNFFSNIIKSLTLTDNTTPANSRIYTLDSGSIEYELPDGEAGDETNPLALIYNNVVAEDWNDYISLSQVNGYDHWFKSDTTKMTVQVTATSPSSITIRQRTTADKNLTYASDINKTIFVNTVGGVDLATLIDKVENEELYLAISLDAQYFYCYDNQLTGNIPDLSANTALENFQCYNNQLTESIPDLSANTALIYFLCYSNQLTGSIPDLSVNTALEIFRCHNNQLTGSIPDLSANTALRYFQCYNNQLTDYTPSTIASTIVLFNASNNALTQTAVDQILADCDTAVLGTGFTLTLNGGTNAIPSAAGLVSKANLEGRGATVTVNT